MIINLKTETLLEESRRNLEAVARQYLDQGLTWEQLLEQAGKGLERAAETWDEHKQFAAHASRFMRKSISVAIAAVRAGKPIPGENALTAREPRAPFIKRCSSGWGTSGHSRRRKGSRSVYSKSFL